MLSEGGGGLVKRKNGSLNTLLSKEGAKKMAEEGGGEGQSVRVGRGWRKNSLTFEEPRGGEVASKLGKSDKAP